MPATQIISLATEEGTRKQAARVAGALRKGQLVALPTETVYGLCCRAASEEAVARIYALKQRPLEKPLPFLLGDPAEVFNFVNEVPLTGRKIMDRYWPGPITLVLGPDPGVALRVPDAAFTRNVLTRTRTPVYGTSINRSGEDPACSASEVLECFPDQLDLVVDGGRESPGAASSVVRVGPDGSWSLLRSGTIGEAALLEALQVTIVLVCTGNTCRSPMAAAALGHLLAKSLGTEAQGLEALGIRILSAGVAAGSGHDMTPEARQTLGAAGIPAPAHHSRPFRADLAEAADLVLGMTPGHVASLRASYPDLDRRVRLLDPDGSTVSDPIGGSLEVYRQSLQCILAALEARLEEIVSLIPTTGGSSSVT